MRERIRDQSGIGKSEAAFTVEAKIKNSNAGEIGITAMMVDSNVDVREQTGIYETASCFHSETGTLH